MNDMSSPPQPSTDGAKAFLEKRDHAMLIDGEWVAAASGDRFESCDPATGQAIASVPRGAQADVDAAVSAARASFKAGEWRTATPMHRAAVLNRIADLMEADIDALAELETLDQGKPLFVGRWAEIPGAIAQFRYFAGAVSRLEGQTIPTGIDYQPEGSEVFAYTLREPVGVVGAIVPWNSPLVLTAMKLAPALAAGCSIVLKPAEDTSLTALRLAAIIEEAGVPKGVMNVVTGFGTEAGSALAHHMDVDKLTFTGSTTTGRAIVSASAQSNLKKVSLELGGKSPVIICDDADLSAAIPGAANSIFFNGGQVCVAGSRLYASAKIFDQVVEGIAEYAAGMAMGHGLDPATQLGPLVSEKHAAKVADFVAQGVAAGATCATAAGPATRDGAFVAPTVLTNVSQDMDVVREEIFGPVLVAQPFDDLDEAVALANDSDFALAAGVWTQSLSTAHRTAAAMTSGTVWINTHLMYDCTLPIGGRKQSGWGRDSGHEALSGYLETKTVCAVL